MFTTDKPVVFAYHGYPWLIHRLAYRHTNHHNLHVRGYKEEGTTTTPFDMAIMNDIDRFHLVMDVIDRVPGLAGRAAHVRQQMAGRKARCTGLHPRARRGRSVDRQLDLDPVTTIDAGARRQRGIIESEARLLDEDNTVLSAEDIAAKHGLVRIWRRRVPPS